MENERIARIRADRERAMNPDVDSGGDDDLPPELRLLLAKDQSTSGRVAGDLAKIEEEKRLHQEEEFQKRQDAYKKRLEAEEHRREETMLKEREIAKLRAQGIEPKRGVAPGALVHVDLTLRYSEGNYYFKFVGHDDDVNDKYEASLILPSGQYAAFTMADLKRVSFFADKFPKLCLGGLLDKKPFQDGGRLTSLGIRPSSTAGFESTNFTFLFEVAAHSGAHPTKFSLQDAASFEDEPHTSKQVQPKRTLTPDFFSLFSPHVSFTSLR